jgi:hypothetical protein
MDESTHEMSRDQAKPQGWPYRDEASGNGRPDCSLIQLTTTITVVTLSNDRVNQPAEQATLRARRSKRVPSGGT